MTQARVSNVAENSCTPITTSSPLAIANRALSISSARNNQIFSDSNA